MINGLSMTFIDLQGRLPIASLFTFDFRTVVHG